MTSRGVIAALCGLMLFGFSACKLDPYETGERGFWRDAGLPPDGQVGDDGQTTADACVPSEEVCDGLDNDCNGIVDDVPGLDSNVNHCGECFNACSFPNAIAQCVEGECEIDACFPNYHNLNADEPGGMEDGCEYQCIVTNQGVEACDGRDNDCNGQVDEGFDLQTDPNHCGSCRNTCVFINGVGECVDGECTLGGCQGGFRDVDGVVNNGCECQIQFTEDASDLSACVQGVDVCPGGRECADPDRDGQSHCYAIPLDICDGRDNDCDGVMDEDATAIFASDSCYPYASGCVEDPPGSGQYDCEGPCTAGTLQCVGGVLRCVGQVGPKVETCNTVDDDCNGVVDDYWDTLNDPNHCGGCGIACGPQLPNAVPMCDNGSCAILSCLPGFWSIDPLAPGCEYECTLTNGGVEKCGDGIDNDCNGQIDEGFLLATDPKHCGACDYDCSVRRPRGAQVVALGDVCVAGTCQYECMTNNWDLDGDLQLGETGTGCEYYCIPSAGGVEICDGLDNDCNGQVDETFNLQTDDENCGGCGRECESIKPANSASLGCTGGRCWYECVTGFVDMNADLNLPGSNGCECEIRPEECDGTDNNCDGIVDNPGATDCTTYYRDRDLDGWGDSADTACLCAPNPNQFYTATQGGDCNDLNPNIHPDAVEVCDGRDNDCDGFADNATQGQGTPLLTRPCYTGTAGTQNNAPCQEGTQTCDPGTGLWGTSCVGQVLPTLEQCSTIDENCNGVVNDGYDLMTDMQHCGACNAPCAIANAVAHCVGGQCLVDYCIPPWYNYDLNPTECEYYCEIQGGAECDGTGDRNCNGIPDADEFDKDTDPFNCGACGKYCAADAPFGTEVDTASGTGTGCVGGNCVYTCATGFVDVNGDLNTVGSNGCECVITNGGVEVCDNEDNDCNGLVDDNIDKDTDPVNCGACDRRCSDLGDSATLAAHHVVFDGCIGGICQYSCMAGYYDLNGDRSSGRPFGSLPGQSNGCEYHCEPTSPGAEVCDGEDNNCDGFTDRTSQGLPLSRPCYEGPLGTQDVGVCKGGVETCVGGVYGACIGQVLPQPAPICGSAEDNNCNTVTDIDEYTIDTDPFNCGACGNNCYDASPPNMYPDPGGSCLGGVCQFTCVAGYRDLENGLTDGCEYQCPVYPPATVETCNGIDDTCNGLVDAEDPTFMPNKPSPDALCSFPRVGGTPCDGVQVVCSNGPGGSYPLAWHCDWAAAAAAYRPATPPVIQFDPNRPNVVLATESLCDDDDNNCDGFVDETYPDLGQECDNGAIGACRDVGMRRCDPNDPQRTYCDLSVLPDPVPGAPNPEQCNGVDDNCDGIVDNADPLDPHRVIDDMVHISHSGLDFWIYTYEASRPDADTESSGVSDARSCSRPGVLPWTNVTYDDAEAACLSVGKRLCTEVEWVTACEGPMQTIYPYGDIYDDGAWCNGADHDGIPGAPHDNVLLPTGDLAMCVSEDAVYDLSGNIREWTDDLRGTTGDGRPIYVVRGGEYNTPAPGLTCAFDLSRAVSSVVLPTIGFRCCSDTSP